MAQIASNWFRAIGGEVSTLSAAKFIPKTAKMARLQEWRRYGAGPAALATTSVLEEILRDVLKMFFV